MTTLTLCLVGQDIDARLPRFMAAFKPLQAQLCLLDHGSRDGTAQVAQAAGAQVQSVAREMPLWQAHNACLEMAQGEWIAWLHIDEIPDAEWVSAVATAVKDPNLGVGCTTLRHALPEGEPVVSYQPRLFRRDARLRFSAERPDELDESLLEATAAHAWQIFALQGHLDCNAMVEEVLDPGAGREALRPRWQQAVDEDPKNLYAWTRLLEQARLWDDSMLLTEAAPQARAALEQLAPAELKALRFAGECLALIAAGLFPEAHKPALLFLYPEAPQEALEFLLPWKEKIAPNAAFLLRLGELHELCGPEHLEQAAAAFDEAVGLRTCTLKIQLATVRPLLGLARVALGLEQTHDALRFLNLALGEAPRDPEALLALTTLSRALGGEAAARDVVTAYVNTYGDAPELHGALGEAALRAGDTQTAVDELQQAVGSLATASPYSELLDEALLCAL